jgi:ATP-dependent protease ClpP protease subunit
MASPKRRNISQKSEMIYDAHNYGLILDTREIFVSPNIGDDYGVAMIDHVVCKQFITNLRLLNSMGNEPILVHMITCGGDWNYGIAMYDAIKESCDDENSSDIIVLSHAHSRSMSSVIPQAASLRILMPNIEYLVHFGEYSDSNNFTSAMANAEQCRKNNETMLDIYISRIKNAEYFKVKKMTEKQIYKWLEDMVTSKQELYLSPEEAVEKGFADGILGSDEYKTIANLMNNE